jgi:hypothetical protein
VTGLRLYWARNDGMSGHVFLDPVDLERLREEMVLQGVDLPKLAPGVHVTMTEIEAALASAQRDPIAVDAKLWRDWLQYLESASVNGGLLIR